MIFGFGMAAPIPASHWGMWQIGSSKASIHHESKNASAPLRLSRPTLHLNKNSLRPLRLCALCVTFRALFEAYFQRST